MLYMLIVWFHAEALYLKKVTLWIYLIFDIIPVESIHLSLSLSALVSSRGLLYEDSDTVAVPWCMYSIMIVRQMDASASAFIKTIQSLVSEGHMMCKLDHGGCI